MFSGNSLQTGFFRVTEKLRTKVDSSRSVLRSYLFLFSSVTLCWNYGNYKSKEMEKNCDLPLTLRVSFRKFLGFFWDFRFEGGTHGDWLVNPWTPLTKNKKLTLRIPLPSIFYCLLCYGLCCSQDGFGEHHFILLNQKLSSHYILLEIASFEE